ncbi:MAG: hypothetical protein AB7F89_09575 [Pirellulaceae bacterium]
MGEGTACSGFTRRRSPHWLCRAVVLVASLGSVSADERPGKPASAAEVLPGTTAVYLEMRDPPAFLRTVLEHPLRSRIEQLDAVRTAREQKPYLDFKAAVAIVESQLGRPWDKLLMQLAGRGLAYGADPATRGHALVVQASDDNLPSEFLSTILNLAKLDANQKGQSNPVRTAEYRGTTAHALGSARVAASGRWLIVASKDDLLKAVLDRCLDGPAASLAGVEAFATVRQARELDTAWGYLDLAALRRAGVAKNVFRSQADNALAELLLGGILAVLPQAPHATLSLHFDQESLQLGASLPFDRSWPGETREHFFGPQAQGTAPPLLDLDATLLSVSAYRDISAMWLRAGDLFDEKTNEGLAKADSNLATLFGGKDFGEDILGAIRPELQLAVTRQTFAAGRPAPAIRLPSFGLVAQLRDPATMQPELRRTFQSLIGFLNIVGAMNGQPQLDQEMQTTDAGQFLFARYLPDAKAKDPLGLRIHFNFSPSVAFVGSKFIVASTEQLARDLAQVGVPPAAGAEPKSPRIPNTVARAEFGAVRAMLADNRSQLVAQNMLKEGHTKEEAEKSVDLLLELIGWLDHAALRLDSSATDLQLSLEAATKPTQAGR